MRRRAAGSETRETAVVKAVLDVFNLMGWHLRRHNVGAAFFGEGASRQLVRFGEAGELDLAGFAPWGTHAEVEVKRPDGSRKLTPDQQDRILLMRQRGCIAGVVSSVEEARDLIDLSESERGWRGKPPGPPERAKRLLEAAAERLRSSEARFWLSEEEYRRARERAAREAARKKLGRMGVKLGAARLAKRTEPKEEE